MNSFSRILTAVGLVLGLSQPAFAQTLEGEPTRLQKPEITDNADSSEEEKLDRRAQQKVVRDFMREVTGRLPSSRPVARFHRPLCLEVAGINLNYADDFANRILDNAEKARVPLATGKCDANALVIFTGESRQELQQARKKNRAIFGELGASGVKTLVESRDDAFAWRMTRMVGLTGRPVGMDLSEFWDNDATGYPSRFTPAIKIDVAGAIVLIDRDATDGMTALQLADYATLRLLAPTSEIEEKEEGAPATIMTLFLDRETAPAQLTEFDLAFLHSVYASADNSLPSSLYGEVISKLARRE